MSRENERERIRRHLVQVAGGCLRDVVQVEDGWAVSISDPVLKVDAAMRTFPLPFADTSGFDSRLSDLASQIAGTVRCCRSKWY